MAFTGAMLRCMVQYSRGRRSFIDEWYTGYLRGVCISGRGRILFNCHILFHVPFHIMIVIDVIPLIKQNARYVCMLK